MSASVMLNQYCCGGNVEIKLSVILMHVLSVMPTTGVYDKGTGLGVYA